MPAVRAAAGAGRRQAESGEGPTVLTKALLITAAIALEFVLAILVGTFIHAGSGERKDA